LGGGGGLPKNETRISKVKIRKKVPFLGSPVDPGAQHWNKKKPKGARGGALFFEAKKEKRTVTAGKKRGVRPHKWWERVNKGGIALQNGGGFYVE